MCLYIGFYIPPKDRKRLRSEVNSQLAATQRLVNRKKHQRFKTQNKEMMELLLKDTNKINEIKQKYQSLS